MRQDDISCLVHLSRRTKADSLSVRIISKLTVVTRRKEKNRQTISN